MTKPYYIKSIQEILILPQMTPEEHSSLLYLLLAIKSAPHKSKDLIKIARKKTAGVKFISFLNYLEQFINNSEIICDEAIKIRKAIR